MPTFLKSLSRYYIHSLNEIRSFMYTHIYTITSKSYSSIYCIGPCSNTYVYNALAN